MADQSEWQKAVRKLFLMTPSQLALLDARRDIILALANELDALIISPLSFDGVTTLRSLSVRLTGVHDVCAFFDQVPSWAFEVEPHPVAQPQPGQIQGTLELQLDVAVSEICHDYVRSHQFYTEHAAGFKRHLSRVLIRNEFTDEINWLASRDVMSTLLERNFIGRYQAYASQHGSPYRDARLANEALCIAKWVILNSSPAPSFRSSSQIGRDFEVACGDALRQLGFEVEFTASSGDFGCDIVAAKDGLRYAVQCKDRGMPSGVTAVQEIAAARSHYKTDFAVVVSRTGYTKAARELAVSARVVVVTNFSLSDIETLARSLD